MNALIFAAGLGTRLKPLTDNMPKALVRINDKPLLQILIEKLIGIGVKEIVINVHHFASQIVEFVEANNSFGIDIKFSDETDMLLETGGGLKKAASLFSDDSPFLVHNVDILNDADLLSLYNHSSHTTMLVSERKTQRYLLFDDNNKLVGWTNISTGEVRSPYPDLDVSRCHRYAFSGVQVFNRELLPYMESWTGKFSIIDFYLSVCDKVDIFGYCDRDLHLLDVGKVDSLAQAECFQREYANK